MTANMTTRNKSQRGYVQKVSSKFLLLGLWAVHHCFGTLKLSNCSILIWGMWRMAVENKNEVLCSSQGGSAESIER